MHVISPFKDKLCCPYCGEEHAVSGPTGAFQAKVACDACRKEFVVVAEVYLKFQTIAEVES